MDIREKELMGVKVFLCEKTSCWLPKKDCILRQKKAQVKIVNLSGYSTSHTFDLVLCCQDCEVGKFICKEQGVKIKRIKVKSFECRGCGKQIPLNQRLDNGSRLCRSCYNLAATVSRHEKIIQNEISNGGLY